MPAKNTKPIKTYLTPAQINSVQCTDPGNMSDLLRQLLKRHVEQNGGRWPDSPGRGKYDRRKD